MSNGYTWEHWSLEREGTYPQCGDSVWVRDKFGIFPSVLAPCLKFRKISSRLALEWSRMELRQASGAMLGMLWGLSGHGPDSPGLTSRSSSVNDAQSQHDRHLVCLHWFPECQLYVDSGCFVAITVFFSWSFIDAKIHLELFSRGYKICLCSVSFLKCLVQQDWRSMARTKFYSDFSHSFSSLDYFSL